MAVQVIRNVGIPASVHSLSVLSIKPRLCRAGLCWSTRWRRVSNMSIYAHLGQDPTEPYPTKASFSYQFYCHRRVLCFPACPGPFSLRRVSSLDGCWRFGPILKPLSLRRILWVILLSFISLSTSENMMERSIPEGLPIDDKSHAARWGRGGGPSRPRRCCWFCLLGWSTDYRCEHTFFSFVRWPQTPGSKYK